MLALWVHAPTVAGLMYTAMYGCDVYNDGVYQSTAVSTIGTGAGPGATVVVTPYGHFREFYCDPSLIGSRKPGHHWLALLFYTLYSLAHVVIVVSYVWYSQPALFICVAFC